MPDPFATAPATLADRLALYRRSREQVERSILPLATSVDGTSFTVQASLHDLGLARGGYVVLEGGGSVRLGQVTDLGAQVRTAPTVGMPEHGLEGAIRLAVGSGRVLDSDGRPFHDVLARPATPAEIGGWLERTRPRRARLTIGELVHAPGVPVSLDSGGLARHTFMCGQSGSGKTYSLGLLLERVLAETSLRVVILDPNSDYVRLGHLRDDADPELAARYSRVADDVAVWTDDATAPHPLRLRFADLPSALQAAVLGLDPIRTATSTPSSPTCCEPSGTASAWSRTWSSSSRPRHEGHGVSGCELRTSACSVGASGARPRPPSLRNCASRPHGEPWWTSARWTRWRRRSSSPRRCS